MTGVRVIQVPSGATHELRRAVLRTGVATSEVRWPGDDEPTTYHLAATRQPRSGPERTIVGVSTWLAERPAPTTTAGIAVATPTMPYRLRGMAVVPSARGAGVGRALLAAGEDTAWHLGADLLWANARSTAVGFYARLGWQVIGNEFTDAATGLPHLTIVRLRPG